MKPSNSGKEIEKEQTDIVGKIFETQNPEEEFYFEEEHLNLEELMGLKPTRQIDETYERECRFMYLS
jgi:hypothetical protein